MKNLVSPLIFDPSSLFFELIMSLGSLNHLGRETSAPCPPLMQAVYHVPDLVTELPSCSSAVTALSVLLRQLRVALTPPACLCRTRPVFRLAPRSQSGFPGQCSVHWHASPLWSGLTSVSRTWCFFVCLF